MTNWLSVVAVCILLACGCQSDRNASRLFDRMPDTDCDPLDNYRGPSLPLEEPCGVAPDLERYEFDMAPLEDFQFGQPGNYRLMSLEECIYAALQSSPVIRELGGALLRSPEQVSTIHDPALAYTDPRFGEEAALSAFDAQLNSQFIFQNNDRAFNNRFLGDNGFLQQNLASYRTGLNKLSATGALFEFNHAIDYDLNNSPSNRFNPANPAARQRSYSYDTFFEAGFRQPLFQGAGVDFNRIAGPNNAPGINNGVLIARTNTDMTLAEFEAQLRDLVSDVENAYWDLYFAYRDLETRIEARNGAYDIWKNADANEDRDAAVKNQAKEQYYRFASDVENAIYGRLNEGTRTNNGSSGGTFRNNGGVRTSERRLRLITGMVLNEAQLIVPSDRPTEAAIVFDWYQSKTDALVYRPELRRQRWQVQRRNLELQASCNHLLPRVDLLGKYRFRGFGENLFGEQGFTQTPTGPDVLPGSAAAGSLMDGDLQEWELGIDVNVPIGFRQQHAAYRNAELAVARETSILREQERQVIFGLSNAMGELTRSIRVRNANLRRLEAAKDQYTAVEVVYDQEDRTIDQLLEAQRRVIEAKTQYYQSQVECMLALRSVHFEKGTLFRYHNIMMTESSWDGEAYRQAVERDQAKSRELNYYFPGLQIGRQIGLPESQFNGNALQPVEFSEAEVSTNAQANAAAASPLMAVFNQSNQVAAKQTNPNAITQGIQANQPAMTQQSPSEIGSGLQNRPSSTRQPIVNPQAFNQVPIIQTNPSNIPLDSSMSTRRMTAVGTGTNQQSQVSALPPVMQPTQVGQAPVSNQSMTPKIPAAMPSNPAIGVTSNQPSQPATPSSKLAELTSAISKVTQKTQQLGANMKNPSKSNPTSLPPITQPNQVNSIRVSDATSGVGTTSRRQTSTRR